MKTGMITSAARENVVNELREAIIGGDFAPGAPVREAEIAERLRVSRTPVREALLVLAVEGLIDLQSGRGARVREYDAGEVHLVHEIRSLVEGRVARFATDRISNLQIGELEKTCGILETLAAGEVRECNQANVAFHRLLFTIVGSDRLTHIGRNLLEVPLPYKVSYWSDPDKKRSSEVAHRKIFEAVRARNPEEAENAMRAHVLATGRYISEWMADRSATFSPSLTPVAGAGAGVRPVRWAE